MHAQLLHQSIDQSIRKWKC